MRFSIQRMRAQPSLQQDPGLCLPSGWEFGGPFSGKPDQPPRDLKVLMSGISWGNFPARHAGAELSAESGAQPFRVSTQQPLRKEWDVKNGQPRKGLMWKADAVDVRTRASDPVNLLSVELVHLDPKGDVHPGMQGGPHPAGSHDNQLVTFRPPLRRPVMGAFPNTDCYKSSLFASDYRKRTQTIKISPKPTSVDILVDYLSICFLSSLFFLTQIWIIIYLLS